MDNLKELIGFLLVIAVLVFLDDYLYTINGLFALVLGIFVLIVWSLIHDWIERIGHD